MQGLFSQTIKVMEFLIESLDPFCYLEYHSPRLYERLWARKFPSVTHPISSIIYLNKNIR
jgi:hypothetical protein